MAHHWFTSSRPVLAAIASSGAVICLTGCALSTSGDSGHTEEFPLSGSELHVKNDFSRVTVEEDGSASDTVVVEEKRLNVGTRAEEPDWSLRDGVLDLGQPCGGTVTVGLCEIRYTVTVPGGTDVTVEQDVPAF